MWPFKRCKHNWELTRVENLKVETYHGTSRYTWIDRICLNCLEKDYQRVEGHITYEKAEKIFKGEKKC